MPFNVVTHVAINTMGVNYTFIPSGTPFNVV